MSTPINEKGEPNFLQSDPNKNNGPRRSSDDQSTFVEKDVVDEQQNHLRVNTNNMYEDGDDMRDRAMSPSQVRQEESKFDDDLEMLRAERMASATTEKLDRTKSMARTQSGNDDFDVDTNPVIKGAVYTPPERPSTHFAKFVKKLHGSNWFIQYFTYIVPVVALLSIPLILGAVRFKNANVGGVRLLWFGVWLEIVWLTLWAGRVSQRSTN
jgi:hypothetical protein